MKKTYIIPSIRIIDIPTHMCANSNHGKPGHGYGDNNHGHDHWKDDLNNEYYEGYEEGSY